MRISNNMAMRQSTAEVYNGYHAQGGSFGLLHDGARVKELMRETGRPSECAGLIEALHAVRSLLRESRTDAATDTAVGFAQAARKQAEVVQSLDDVALRLFLAGMNGPAVMVAGIAEHIWVEGAYNDHMMAVRRRDEAGRR